MAGNIAQKLIADHLVEGELAPGVEVGIRVDQTLTQDATGTMVMLELEAMALDRVRTELSAAYAALRCARQDTARLGQPYLCCGSAGDARHRRRWPGGRARDGR